MLLAVHTPGINVVGMTMLLQFLVVSFGFILPVNAPQSMVARGTGTFDACDFVRTTQMAQTAVCNRHHTPDQQLCRWLRLSLDRLQGNQLVMTQELIANMLGVRREGVTEAALKLQKAALISYARGHISVLDRPGLEARTCECYSVVKREYDRLLPGTVAT
ncbi:sodium:sulfate symporter family protein [Acidovorax sp. CF316]|nr:sodium:sulfate symporter family protein [Acidovorax sp. CF316]